jgi:non-specific protein-tyrosine kinase
MNRNGFHGSDKLIAYYDPSSPVAEAYRTLRTNIQFSSLDKPVRTLLATSSGPEEGKSTTLANLAVVLAQAEKRVILVDCDLRKPSLHKLFGLPNTAGLTSLLVQDDLRELPLQEVGLAGLSVLTSGPLPPNPSELLGSQRLAHLIDRLKEEADYVLFDTPPVIAVTDAAVLATRLDGAILVVSAGKTRRDLAQKAKAQLERVNANILGVVLNNVKLDADLNRYYGTAKRKK